MVDDAVTADAFHVAHQPAAPRGSMGRSLRYDTLILFEQTTYWDQYSSTDLWNDHAGRIEPDGAVGLAGCLRAVARLADPVVRQQATLISEGGSFGRLGAMRAVGHTLMRRIPMTPPPA